MQNAAAMKAAPMPCRPASNAAVEEGRISRSRLESYLGLQGELAKTPQAIHLEEALAPSASRLGRNRVRSGRSKLHIAHKPASIPASRRRAIGAVVAKRLYNYATFGIDVQAAYGL